MPSVPMCHACPIPCSTHRPPSFMFFFFVTWMLQAVASYNDALLALRGSGGVTTEHQHLVAQIDHRLGSLHLQLACAKQRSMTGAAGGWQVLQPIYGLYMAHMQLIYGLHGLYIVAEPRRGLPAAGRRSPSPHS